MGRRFTVLVLLFAVVTGWVAPQVLTYVCAMDGLARAHCCCAPHGELSAASEHAALERAGCCEVQLEATVTANATMSAPERLLAHAHDGVAMPPASSWALPASTRAHVHAARGPPRGIGPPLFLRHRVLLI